MGTLGDVNRQHGGGGPPLLSGKHVPEKITKLTVTIKELREAPATFKAPAIIDFDKPVYEKQGMSLNVTNLRRLALKLGFADPDSAEFEDVARKAKGKSIVLTFPLVNNPSTGKLGRSIAIA